MKQRVLFLVFSVLAVLIPFLYLGYEYKYPNNEWHSRHDCKQIVGGIKASIEVFRDLNEGKLPNDLHELVSEDRYRYSLVCPSQLKAVRKMAFFSKLPPPYVSSYRFLVPGKRFADINDSTVIIREIESNHPKGVVGEYIFPAGYFVIIKDNNSLSIDFVYLSPIVPIKNSIHQ